MRATGCLRPHLRSQFTRRLVQHHFEQGWTHQIFELPERRGESTMMGVLNHCPTDAAQPVAAAIRGRQS